MIDTEWLREDEVLRVRPDGPIDDGDFDAVAAVVDPAIARKGRLEGLLVEASGFSGWDDAHALLAHLRFVNEHHDKVARIAVVGDQWWLRAAPTMEMFLGVRIRIFRTEEMESARSWLLESPPEPAAVTFLPESEGAQVALRVTGRLRDSDYDSLKAELTRRFPAEGKLRLLVVIDQDFRGWTPKAAFDDMAMAFSPWSRRIERLAVVAGPGMVRWFVANFPTAFLPYKMKLFEPGEIEAAHAWLRA